MLGMDFSLSALHTHDDWIQNDFDLVTGTANCSKLIDVTSKNLNKPQIAKETLANIILNLTEVLSVSRAQLKTAAARISELSADQLVNQKKIIEMQDKLIENQTEQMEAVKAAVTTEIKSFSDVVKQSGVAAGKIIII